MYSFGYDAWIELYLSCCKNNSVLYCMSNLRREGSVLRMGGMGCNDNPWGHDLVHYKLVMRGSMEGMTLNL